MILTLPWGFGVAVRSVARQLHRLGGFRQADEPSPYVDTHAAVSVDRSENEVIQHIANVRTCPPELCATRLGTVRARV